MLWIVFFLSLCSLLVHNFVVRVCENAAGQHVQDPALALPISLFYKWFPKRSKLNILSSTNTKIYWKNEENAHWTRHTHTKIKRWEETKTEKDQRKIGFCNRIQEEKGNIKHQTNNIAIPTDYSFSINSRRTIHHFIQI